LVSGTVEVPVGSIIISVSPTCSFVSLLALQI